MHQITSADAGLVHRAGVIGMLLSTSKDIVAEQGRNSERQKGSEALSVKQVMFLFTLSSWRSKVSTPARSQRSP